MNFKKYKLQEDQSYPLILRQSRKKKRSQKQAKSQIPRLPLLGVQHNTKLDNRNIHAEDPDQTHMGYLIAFNHCEHL